MSKILLITPPLTQLNTPYPATAYLKGFLKQFGYTVGQKDMGIELVNSLFSRVHLTRIFSQVEATKKDISDNTHRILALKDEYLNTIDVVMRFLRGKDESMAHRICTMDYLPQASRFDQVADLEWAFGSMGIRDKARLLATLYIEDLGDFIGESVSSYFGFTRYAEQIARAATSFDELELALSKDADLVDGVMLTLLEEHILKEKPEVVGFSVPFPGNLYGALRCGKFLKQKYPKIKITLGGGYANTELRELSDPRVFDYVDFITLDDGEAPLLQLLKYIDGQVADNELKRTYLKKEGRVVFIDSIVTPDFSHAEVGTPDYEGLNLEEYLSVIEVANPMHRLWSDGRWNKLTLAHGCYWHRCTFCDTSLDYIKRYSAVSASLLVDRIEAVVEQTGETGFHFTDEAAPPVVLRDLAIELLRRKTQITWWTNIRFEKSFTPDLARLLALSGCIAVSGGLEVASDRLLKLIKKGTNIKQVAKVTNAFTEAGIMVHAYLMYGFPTQTNQETVDALEVVRQLFESGLIQSAYWHRFTMTIHSPVGQDPEAFSVKNVGPGKGTFANNDLLHDDPKGANHSKFQEGLNKAVYNYMHGVGFDESLDIWFDFKVPRVSVSKNVILNIIEQNNDLGDTERLQQRVVWTGAIPSLLPRPEKKGKVSLLFISKSDQKELRVVAPVADWLIDLSKIINITDAQSFPKLEELENSFEEKTGQAFLPFLLSKEWKTTRAFGLILIR